MAYTPEQLQQALSRAQAAGDQEAAAHIQGLMGRGARYSSEQLSTALEHAQTAGDDQAVAHIRGLIGPETRPRPERPASQPGKMERLTEVFGRNQEEVLPRAQGTVMRAAMEFFAPGRFLRQGAETLEALKQYPEAGRAVVDELRGSDPLGFAKGLGEGVTAISRAAAPGVGRPEDFELASEILKAPPTTVAHLAGGAVESVGIHGRKLAGDIEYVRSGEPEPEHNLLGRASAGIQRAGQAIPQATHNLLKPREEYQEHPAVQFSGAATSLASFAVTGAVGRAASRNLAVRRGWAANKIAAAERIGTYGSVLPLAGALGAQETYERAMAYIQDNPDLGLTERDALNLAVFGNVAGWAQVANIEVYLRKMPRLIRGKMVGPLLNDLLLAGASEFTVETTGAIIQNKIAQFYDVDRELLDGVFERGGVAGLAALFVRGATMPYLGGRTQRGPKELLEEAAQKIIAGEDAEGLMLAYLNEIGPEGLARMDEDLRNGNFENLSFDVTPFALDVFERTQAGEIQPEALTELLGKINRGEAAEGELVDLLKDEPYAKALVAPRGEETFQMDQAELEAALAELTPAEAPEAAPGPETAPEPELAPPTAPVRPPEAPEAAPEPEIAPEAAPEAAPEPETAPERQAAEFLTTPERPDVQIPRMMVPASEIQVEAETYQFKAEADAEGVTDRLRGVRRWDDLKAGRVVLHERSDGVFVADGHQRVAMARRLEAEGHPPISLDAIVLREADGFTTTDARVFAATKNLAEGTGTAWDAARIFREAGEHVNELLETLPPNSAIVRDGRRLANLSEEATQLAINNDIDPAHAGLAAQRFEEPTDQLGAIQALARFKPSTQGQVAALLEDLAATGVRVDQSDMFGGLDDRVIVERMKLLDQTRSRVMKDRAIMAGLVRNKPTIEAAAQNVVDQAGSEAAKSEAEAVARVIEQVNTDPELNAHVTEQAEQVAAGRRTRSKAVGEILSRIRTSLERAESQPSRREAPAEREVSPEPRPEVETQTEAPDESQPSLIEPAPAPTSPIRQETERAQTPEPQAERPTAEPTERPTAGPAAGARAEPEPRPAEGGRPEPTAPGPVGGVGRTGPERPGVRPSLRVAGAERLPTPRVHVDADSYQGGLDEGQQLATNLAIDRFDAGGRGFMLADGTGVGKTRIILATADQWRQRSGKPVLIITQNQQIIDGSFTDDAAAMGLRLGDFELGTYVSLRDGKIGQGDYGLVIFDEGHNLKNVDSKQTIAANNVNADHRMFATATPMDRITAAVYFIAEITGRPSEEIYNQLGLSVQEKMDDRTGQMFRWAQLRQGVQWSDVRQSLLDIRNEAVEQGALIRREYPFYGRIGDEVVTLSESSADATAQQTRIDEHWNYLIESARSPQAKRNFAGQRIGELSRWTEHMKVPALIRLLDQKLADGRQVIVVAEGVNDTLIKALNREVPGAISELARHLQERGIPFAKIYGPGNKSGEVAKFQDGKVQVALATPKSGGAGINLDDVVGDRPRTMIIATANFSGDVFDQILGRISRRNTASPAEIINLKFSDALSDNRRGQILTRKLDALRAIQAGEDLDVAHGVASDLEATTEGGTDAAVAGGQALRIESLSDRAGIVVGDTYAHRARLRGLGLRWYPARQGWMFPKSREAEIRSELADLLDESRVQEDQPGLFPDQPTETAQALEKRRLETEQRLRGREAVAPDEGPGELFVDERFDTRRRQQELVPEREGRALDEGDPLPPNSVIADARRMDGSSIGRVAWPHDGTREGIRKANDELRSHLAERHENWSNVNTRTGVTDQQGNPVGVVSPNGQNIAPAGTAEARYIFGDVSAAQEQGARPRQKELAPADRQSVVLEARGRFNQERQANVARRTFQEAHFAYQWGLMGEMARLDQQRISDAGVSFVETFASWIDNSIPAHLKRRMEQNDLTYQELADEIQQSLQREIREPGLASDVIRYAGLFSGERQAFLQAVADANLDISVLARAAMRQELAPPPEGGTHAIGDEVWHNGRRGIVTGRPEIIHGGEFQAVQFDDGKEGVVPTPRWRNRQDKSPRFQRTAPKVRHRPKGPEQVRQWTQKLMGPWKGAPGFTVVANEAQLPAEIREHIDAAAPGQVTAVFHRGKVYVVANRIQSREALETAVFHEVFGHYGPRKLLGKEFVPLLDRIWQTFGEAGLSEVINDYFPPGEFNAENVEHRRIAADEMLARLAEQNKRPSIVDKAIALIRKWLRKMGFNSLLKLNKSDLRQIIAQGRDLVTSGMPTAEAAFDGGPSFHRRNLHEHGIDLRRLPRHVKVVDSNDQLTGQDIVRGIKGPVAAVFDPATGRGVIALDRAGDNAGVLIAQQIGFPLKLADVIGEVKARRLNRDTGNIARALMEPSVWKHPNVDSALIRAKAWLKTHHGIDATTEMAANFLAAAAHPPGKSKIIIRPPRGPTYDLNSREPGDIIPGEFPRLRDKTHWSLGWTMLFESASDKLRQTSGLEYMSEKIDDYFDGWDRYRGELNTMMKPALRAFAKLPRRARKRVEEDWGEYWRAVTYAKEAEQNKVWDRIHPVARQLLEAWIEVGRLTGDRNQAQGVKVWTGARWRPIGKVDKYFPRVFRPEVIQAIVNPSSNPELWNQIVDSLMASGVIQSREGAQKYIKKTIRPSMISSDFFSNLELARHAALPEIFYDWSMTPAMQYIDGWAQRFSQIEQFGQARGEKHPDLLRKAAKEVLDQRTSNYLAAVADRIYEVEPNTLFFRTISTLNMIATGTQLANWATAYGLNLPGGMTINWFTWGEKHTLQALRDMATDWSGVRDLAWQIGVLREDYLSLVRDGSFTETHSQQLSKLINEPGGLRKAVNWLMRYGGYMPTEHFIRIHSMLAGRYKLIEALDDVRKDPKGKAALKQRAWFERNHFDFDRLIAEGGAGTYTEKFMRYAAKITQGSYRIDQTPVFVDTAIGRFALKYMKFGTQVNRLAWMNHVQPFLKSVAGGERVSTGERVRTFTPMLRFFMAGMIGGRAILEIRDRLFDYIRPGPGWDELEAALEDDESANKLAVVAAYAFHSINGAGLFGFIGNYAQFGMDFTQQSRVKNPLDPPGLASVKALIEVAMRVAGQVSEHHPVGLTPKDIDEITEQFFSYYRAAKRPGLKLLGAISQANYEAALQAAHKDRRYIRALSARYARQAGIEGRRGVVGGFWLRSALSPTKRDIVNALLVGDGARAAALYARFQDRLEDPDEAESFRRSIASSVRANQPIRILGKTVSGEDRQNFLEWADKNLSPENYQRIIHADERYRDAAREIGVNINI